MKKGSVTPKEMIHEEDNFHRVFHDSHIGIAVVDENFRFIEINDAFCRMTGYSGKELKGKSFGDITHPDHLVKDMASARKLLTKEIEIYKTEKKYLRKDQNVIWASVSASVVYKKNGDFSHFLSIVEDITDRKSAEEALKKNRAGIERINSCLLSLEQDYDANINKLTALCGELLGASCALYNRLEDGFLISAGQWQTPDQFNPKDNPDGHICYDVIRRNQANPLIIHDLPNTDYRKTDPNVSAYELKTYCGQVVKSEGKAIGSLCVVYQHDVLFSDDDLQILEMIATAIGREDTRKQSSIRLQHDQELISNLQALSRIGGWEYDIVKDKLIWTDEVYKIHELEKREYEPNVSNSIAFYKQPEQVIIDKAFQLLISEGTPYDLKLPLIASSGKLKWVRTLGKVVAGQDTIQKVWGNIIEITEQKYIEDTQRFLIQSGWKSGQESFFNALTRFLAELLDAEYCCIGKFSPDKQFINSISAYYFGQFGNNIQHSFEDHPQHLNEGNITGICEHGLRLKYPNNHLFRDIQAESYAGIELYGGNGEPIGLISLLSQKPLNNPGMIESILKLVATRAAGEIEQQESRDKINSLLNDQQVLTQFISELMKLHSVGEIYQLLGRTMNTLLPGAYIALSSMNPERNSIYLSNHFGFGNKIQQIIDETGIDPGALEITVPELSASKLQAFSSLNLIDHGTNGIYKISAHKLNRTQCQKISGILDISSVYSIGFSQKDEVYGGVAILLKDKLPVQRSSVIESLVSQASIALHRTMTEEKLKMEHQNLQAILSSSPVGMIILDENLLIKEANQAAADVFNMTLKDLTQLRCGDFLGCVNRHNDENGCGYSKECQACELMNAITRSLKERIGIKDLESLFHLQGIESPMKMWLRFSVEPVILNSNLHLILAIQNITETKKAEETLKNTHDHYQKLIENAPDGITLINAEGEFLYTTPNCLTMFGYTREDLLSLRPNDLTHPDDREKVIQSLLEVIEHPGKPLFSQYRFLHKEGTWQWIESTFSNMLHEPSVQAIVINFRHIGERKAAEEALKSSEAKYRRLTENAPDIIFRYELLPDEKLSYVNQAVESILGYTLSECYFIENIVSELVHPEDYRTIAEYRKFTEFPVKPITLRWRSKSGEYKWLESILVPIYEYGHLSAIEGISRDITADMKAREALKESEARYRTLFDGSPDAIILADTETGIIVDVNSAASRLLKLPVKEIIGLHQTQLHPESVKEYSNKTFNEKTKVPTNSIILKPTQNLVIASDGTEVPVEILANVVQLKGRNVLQGMFRDITERKQSEIAIRESEDKFRSLAESSPYAVMIYQNDVWAYVNPAGQNMCGYTEEELSTMNFWEIVAPEYQDYVKQLGKRRQFGSVPDVSYEFVILTKSGKRRWAYLTSSSFIYKGKPAGIVSAIDITDRKQSEMNLIQSEAKYKSLFNEMLEGFALHEIITDKKGKPVDYRFLDVNPGFERLTGFKAKDIIGKTVMELMPGTEPVWIQSYGKVALTGKPRHLVNFSKELNKYYSVAAFSPEKGKFATLIEDITERKLAEEEIHTLNARLEHRVIERTAELEKAMNEMEAFSYSVSHDLRTPLRAIEGFSRILAGDHSKQLDEEGKRTLNVILENAGKMDQLITDLLTLSKISRTGLKIKQINMKSLVQEILKDRQSMINDPSCTIKLADLIPAEGDSNLIKQVWINLIDNALKYTSPKDDKKIEIGCYHENLYNVYYVKDNGVGFNPEYTSRLFLAFQRLHKSKDFEGTGVGLAIVHRIVSRHNGKVWAEGGVDKGAVFYFSLPIESKKE